MLISVVMPVYNGEKHVMEAVTGILTQTYTNFEFIIVNDGSSDRTRELLDTITDPRVKVVHLQHNLGAAAAMNIAVGDADGSWIAVQDADDLSLPERLQVQVDYIRENPHISAVSSLIECISGEASVSTERLRQEERYNNLYVTGEQIEQFRFFGNPICHGSLLFSKTLFDQIGGYDPQYRIAYDYDLWMKLFQIAPIEKINIPLYHWRVHPASLCHSDMLMTCIEVMKVSSKIARNYYFAHLSRAPRVAVIGPKLGSTLFWDQIGAHSGFQIIGYLDSGLQGQANLVSLLYANEWIDGVIVLDHPEANQLVDELSDQGMFLNQTVFWLWNEAG